MVRMKAGRTWVGGAVALVAGSALVMAVPGGVAVGDHSPPSPIQVEDIVSPAFLEARGAAVILTVVVSCPEAPESQSTGNLSVQVTQRVGNKLAYGNEFTHVPCTGEPEQVTLQVSAGAGGAPFKRGDAAVLASLSVCSSVYCGPSITEFETIEVSRG